MEKEKEKFDSAALIIRECDELKELLLDKNRKYGDSVLRPMKMFSKAGSQERIRSRLDDKVSRLVRGDISTDDEDVIKDMLGYLILLRVAEKLGLE